LRRSGTCRRSRTGGRGGTSPSSLTMCFIPAMYRSMSPRHQRRRATILRGERPCFFCERSPHSWHCPAWWPASSRG
jgi:hypothetical protein